MNKSLRLTEMDIFILYFMPKPSTSLDIIMVYYASGNRDAIPSREELEHCLNIACAIGAMTVTQGKFLLTEEWFERLHQFDASSENEMFALGAVRELLELTSWECIHPTGYTLSQEEYDAAIGQIRSSGFKRLLGRNA